MLNYLRRSSEELAKVSQITSGGKYDGFAQFVASELEQMPQIERIHPENDAWACMKKISEILLSE